MSVLDIWSLIKDTIQEYSNIVIVLMILLLTLVQVTPIKINPWSYIGKLFSKLFSYIGKIMMKDSTDQLKNLDAKIDKLQERIQSDISKLDKKVDDLSTIVDENEIDRIRWELLDFSNSCQRGINHTQNEFQHAFKLYTKYHGILERSDLENGEVDREMRYLEGLYIEKKENDSFLK